MHIAATLSSNADPWMPEQNLSRSHHHALSRWIHGRVRRMLDDVKCVEENPQRMRRISEPPVGKRIRGQQVAEFIMHFRLRHRKPVQ